MSRLPGSPTRARLIGRKRPSAAGFSRRPTVKPPSDLPAAVKAVWLRDAPTIPGGLRESDVRAWTLSCRAMALAEDLMTRAESAVQLGDKHAGRAISAAVRLARLATDLRRPFGLSPIDRQRLHVEPEREEDELERFRREHPRA